MANKSFDERYPAMFQPGGEGHPVMFQPGGDGPETGPEPATARVSHENQPEQLPAPPTAARTDGTLSTDGAAWRWWLPLAAAVAMIAAGLFALTAQYWLPASVTVDPAAFHGIVLQPWGQMIYPAAPALLGTGIGVLGALLLMASRRNAAAESRLRGATAVLAALAGAAGWVSLFATYLFPEVTYNYNGMDGSGQQPPMPWTYLMMPVGTWLLSVAVLLLAALFAVPRRWQDGEPGGEGRPVGGHPSAGRALVLGAAAAVAGILALFAPYLFPLATGSTTIEVSTGNTISQSGWPFMGQFLAAPLLLSGLLVLAWAVLHLALAPGRRPEPAQGTVP